MLHIRAWTAVFAVALIGAFPAVPRGKSGRLTVRVDGIALPPGRVLAIVTEADGRGPDVATLTLRSGFPQSASGRALDIAAIDGQPIFKGEIVSIEPSRDRSGPGTLTIRASDRLHRLARTPRTRAFVGVSDADIVRQLALEAGLQAAVVGPEASNRHDAVYQQNQTDLEFLQARAALIGYEVFTDETTLHFQKRRDTLPTPIGCGPDEARVGAFLAWIASPTSVQEVAVRGWDPVKKQEIVGNARQQVIPLSVAASELEPAASTIDLDLVEGLGTAEAVHAAAAGALSALTARDLSAELAVQGRASLRAGSHVLLQGVGAAFDGRYIVTQVSHRFGRGSGGAWHTLLRALRADRARFLLPEVGEEVLVAFQQGDVNQPYIVGSLWNSPDGPPPDASPCGRRR